jgi:hypothetical protein
LSGDTEKSRQEYAAFFGMWKDAVADLPVLVEAKREFAKFKDEGCGMNKKRRQQ